MESGRLAMEAEPWKEPIAMESNRLQKKVWTLLCEKGQTGESKQMTPVKKEPKTEDRVSNAPWVRTDLCCDLESNLFPPARERAKEGTGELVC